MILCIASVTVCPNFFDPIQKLEKSNPIQDFSIVKDFISVRKPNKHDLLNHLKALHQNPETELKNFDLILC